MPTLIAIVALASACAPIGPDLPPAESMRMDLGAFNQVAVSAKSDDAGRDGAKKSHTKTAGRAHFNAAAWRIGLLNLRMVTAFAPPAAIFYAALSVDPIFEDDAWVWDYETTSGKHAFRARLEGRFDEDVQRGGAIDLKMIVTCATCKVPTKDFTWYTGRFQPDEGKGHWLFFHPEIAQDDQTFVRADYEVRDATHRSLVFTNQRTDGHPDAGDVVAYDRKGDLVRVTVHDESRQLGYTAEVSVSTGAGWLQVPDYNLGKKACWDADRRDAACE